MTKTMTNLITSASVERFRVNSARNEMLREAARSVATAQQVVDETTAGYNSGAAEFLEMHAVKTLRERDAFHAALDRWQLLRHLAKGLAEETGEELDASVFGPFDWEAKDEPAKPWDGVNDLQVTTDAGEVLDNEPVVPAADPR